MNKRGHTCILRIYNKILQPLLRKIILQEDWMVKKAIRSCLIILNKNFFNINDYLVNTWFKYFNFDI